MNITYNCNQQILGLTALLKCETTLNFKPAAGQSHTNELYYNTIADIHGNHLKRSYWTRGKVVFRKIRELTQILDFTKIPISEPIILISSAHDASRMRMAKPLQHWKKIKHCTWSEQEGKNHYSPLQCNFVKRVKYYPLSVSTVKHDTPHCCVRKTCSCVSNTSGKLRSSTNTTQCY